jgi:glycosyltransferase involved in cell wall biosynthesis
MTAKPFAATLFVSTFDMPRHLKLVFAGISRQSAKNFEVVVCDDGSGDETRKLVEKFQKQSPFPVHHVWQEHKGFRKCRILNEGLRRSTGEVCIFLDGDCIPHKHYVRDHLQLQEEGRYLAGRRVELGPKISEHLSIDQINKGYFDFPHPSFIKSVFSGDSQYLQRSIRYPWQFVRTLLGMNRVVDLKGCNYSVPRAALEKLNGFDEDYEGYGREDTDVEIRLQHLGLKIKSLKGVALQFHVWHPRREFTPSNDNRLKELKASKRFRCEQGLHRK